MLSQDKTRQGIGGSDLYQMYAYGRKYSECEILYLIYPKDNDLDVREYDYFKSDTDSLKLKVIFFDLKENSTSDNIS